jgi:hypothetical protein
MSKCERWPSSFLSGVHDLFIDGVWSVDSVRANEMLGSRTYLMGRNFGS